MSDLKSKLLGMYKLCLTPRCVSEGHLKTDNIFHKLGNAFLVALLVYMFHL